MDAECSSQPNCHGLMVSVGARHTGELGFESLLRHFFKNLTQHLALPESPAGQTVCHHLFTSTNQWMNHSKSGGPSVLVDKHYSGQLVRWFIHAGPTVWWTIRKWMKQPWINSGYLFSPGSQTFPLHAIELLFLVDMLLFYFCVSQRFLYDKTVTC